MNSNYFQTLTCSDMAGYHFLMKILLLWSRGLLWLRFWKTANISATHIFSWRVRVGCVEGSGGLLWAALTERHADSEMCFCPGHWTEAVHNSWEFDKELKAFSYSDKKAIIEAERTEEDWRNEGMYKANKSKISFNIQLHFSESECNQKV